MANQFVILNRVINDGKYQANRIHYDSIWTTLNMVDWLLISAIDFQKKQKKHKVSSLAYAQNSTN